MHNVSHFILPFEYGLLCDYLQAVDASMGFAYRVMIWRRAACTIAVDRTHYPFKKEKATPTG